MQPTCNNFLNIYVSRLYFLYWIFVDITATMVLILKLKLLMLGVSKIIFDWFLCQPWHLKMWLMGTSCCCSSMHSSLAFLLFYDVVCVQQGPCAFCVHYMSELDVRLWHWCACPFPLGFLPYQFLSICGVCSFHQWFYKLWIEIMLKSIFAWCWWQWQQASHSQLRVPIIWSLWSALHKNALVMLMHFSTLRKVTCYILPHQPGTLWVKCIAYILHWWWSNATWMQKL